MKNHYPVICILLSVFLAGCAAVPDAVSDNSTMLVGEVYFTGKNLTGTPSLNSGLSKNATEVTIADGNGNEYLLKTDRAGIFYLPNIQEGPYYLVKLLKRSDRGGWVSVTLNPRFEFPVTGGRVNNAGRIEWHRDGKKSSFTYSETYEPVKSDFGKRYKKSNWNTMSWVNVPLK
ncbi:hypothetical protein [Breznakiella homolactica]|uniref:Carboxypeptidase regulatory-like domain-containing protein n=1 Tax=Breznakiella homolactica TaxID=2798577 RepID=A0A7T7XPJ4_9SPIR|nr:hypothetical protein [Breznakiella homolactica]QQO10027.1 hypothetical protein JFL75_03685 [Breznakiella homolactica]